MANRGKKMAEKFIKANKAEWDKEGLLQERAGFLPKDNTISFCDSCYCMTHTVKGACAKCGKPKKKPNKKTLTNYEEGFE